VGGRSGRLRREVTGSGIGPDGARAYEAAMNRVPPQQPRSGRADPSGRRAHPWCP
jgi:hypothetical protein